MIRKILITSALAASLALGAAAYAAPTPDASATAAPAKPAPAKPAAAKAAPAKAAPAKPSLYARAQAKLKELGDYTGAVNGQRTKMTVASIEKYQKDKGLKVSGRLTPETVKSLGV